MLNLKTLALVAVAALTTVPAANASVYLSKNLLPVADIDGTGIADSLASSNAVTSFDILFNPLGSAPRVGKSYGFAVEIQDFAEVLSLTNVVLGAGVSIVNQNSHFALFKFTPTGTPALNSVLASFSFITGTLGAGSDDDAADFTLESIRKVGLIRAGVIDPLSNLVTNVAKYDLQAAPSVQPSEVPLPAAGLLLAGALGLLGLRKRRS